MLSTCSARAARCFALIVLMGALAGCGTVQRVVPSGSSGSSARGDASQKSQLYRLAATAAQSGDTRTAIGLYQQIASDNPQDVEAWSALGELLLAAGEAQSAADAFAKSLQIKETDVRARRGYARAMLALQRPDAAWAYVEPLLKTESGNVGIINLAAVTLDLRGEHKQALALYRQGLKLEPTSVALRNNMALSAALAGAFDTALALLEPLAEGLESTRQARQNLALVHGLAGNYQEAERLSSIDLDAASVTNNMAFFSAMAASEPSPSRAANLQPRPANHGSSANRRSSDPSLSVALGLAVDGETLALAGQGHASWYIRLGPYADAVTAKRNWQNLKTSHPAMIAKMHRLASGQKDAKRLHIGPLASKAAALDLCRSIAVENVGCMPIEL